MVRQQAGQMAPANEDAVMVKISTEAIDETRSPSPVEDSDDAHDVEDQLPGKKEKREDGRRSIGPVRVEDMTSDQLRLLHKLQARDAEVRAHEGAHIAASGGMASAPSYTYQIGPDGHRYAIGGEVRLTVPRGGTPEARLRIAEQMRSAAMAPASPSSQDQAVAAAAMQQISRARAAIEEEAAIEREEMMAAEPNGSEEDGEDRPLRAARMGGSTDFGPAEHLHMDGCSYCAASAARFIF